MSLGSDNRSFLALLALAAALGSALVAGACALASLLLYRLAVEGPGAVEPAWKLAPLAAFLAIVAAGPLLGVRSLGRQIASSRQLCRRIAALAQPPGPELERLARSARLGGRVRTLNSPEPFSFAYGAWRPRVVVSRGLVERASEDELRAVLVHERYHVRSFDPLKLVLARAIVATFVLVPAARALERRYLAGRELAADRRAVSVCGRRSLAGALLKVVRGPAWPELSTAAAIGGADVLNARVTQIESGREPASPLSRLTLAASGAVLVLLLACFTIGVAGLGGFGALFATSDADLRAVGWGAVTGLGCLVPFGFAGWLAWRWHSA